jgi:hypothetical protein
VPQLGAIVVPLNYRLTAEDFVYMIEHSGAKVVCVHADYLDAIDSVRARLPGVRHFVALEGERRGWVDYESTLLRCVGQLRPAGHRGIGPHLDQLYERHDLAAQRA